MTTHPIVHVDFPAKNPQEAGKFYSEIFGWKIFTDNALNYTMFQVGEGSPGGGFVKVENGGTQPGDVLVYLGTDNIDETLEKVKAMGGSVVMPKGEIPGNGWLAVFLDPSGNKVGLYTAPDHQH